MTKSKAEIIHDEVVKLMLEARNAKNLSHQKLADIVGVSRPAISFIESGKRNPSLLNCIRISQALDIDLAELINKAVKK